MRATAALTALAFAAWALGACAGDATAPDPASGSAYFVLAAVDGVPVPALVDSTETGAAVWVTDGVLLLQSDGRCRNLVRADSTRDVDPQQPYLLLWDMTCTYDLSGRLLRAWSSLGGDVLFGALSATSLAEARRASLVRPLTSARVRLDFTREWDATAAAERIWRLDNPGFRWGAAAKASRLRATRPGARSP